MAGTAFWDGWLGIWNGDYSRAEQLVDPRFTVHAAMLDGSRSEDIRGPEGLTAWIDSMRRAIDGLEFTTVVGPLHEGELIAGHWRVTGDYAGGMPNASAAAGTRIGFTGTDLLRLEGGRAVEYWLVSDTLSLAIQLGMTG